MLSSLTKAADIADRILLARFEQLESSPYPIPPETFEQALDYLARLTAIRKSLVHLDQTLAAPLQTPGPAPSTNTVIPPARSTTSTQSTQLPAAPSLRQPSLHEIAEIPAMPLDRIPAELAQITAALTHDLNHAPSPSSIGSMRSIGSIPSIPPIPDPTVAPAQTTPSTESDPSTSSLPAEPALPGTQSPEPAARNSAPIAQDFDSATHRPFIRGRPPE